MAMKEIFAIVFGLWLVFRCAQAAPSYTRDVEDFENTMTVDLAKRVLHGERALRNLLKEIEDVKRASPCNANEYYDGMTCKLRSKRVLHGERALRNLLKEIEDVKRGTTCGQGEVMKGMKCVKQK
jgi:ribosomal protein S21